jgi:putative cardiolipin synthase
MQSDWFRMGRFKSCSALLCVYLTLQACATLPENNNQTESFALEPASTVVTDLDKSSERYKAGHNDQTGAYLLPHGLDAFAARAVLAAKAQRSLDVQYYLFHNDSTGIALTSLLLDAADRGVQVRILADDMDLNRRDAGVASLNAHPNVEIRIFNPFTRGRYRLTQFITGFGKLTRRMHNKSFIADNQFAILGGRNIGDEYFDVDPDNSFGDLDVLLSGPAVAKVSHAFDLYWNSPLAYPAETVIDAAKVNIDLDAMRAVADTTEESFRNSTYRDAIANSKLANDLRNNTMTFYWADKATVIYDLPEKIVADRTAISYHMHQQLKPFADGIKKEFTVISPYFVPGDAGTAFLTGLAQRGVKVRILTNSLASNDVSAVHAGYSKYRKDLLKAGVELYEMQTPLQEYDTNGNKVKRPIGSSNTSLHAKSFAFDRETLFIGSMNLDPRSFLENTEIGVLIESTELSGFFVDFFTANIAKAAFRLELVDGEIQWHGWEDGKAVTYTKDPYTSWWDRFAVGFIGLFPIQSQL